MVEHKRIKSGGYESCKGHVGQCGFGIVDACRVTSKNGLCITSKSILAAGNLMEANLILEEPLAGLSQCQGRNGPGSTSG